MQRGKGGRGSLDRSVGENGRPLNWSITRLHLSPQIPALTNAARGSGQP